MKTKLIIWGFTLAIMPTIIFAQETKKTKGMHSYRRHKMPSWGKFHNYANDKYVYFPDYYVFYSPDRGYIYWDNNNWTTSRDMPSSMSRIDLNAARLQILDASLSSFPEKDFSTYANQNPAQSVNGVMTPMPQVR